MQLSRALLGGVGAASVAVSLSLAGPAPVIDEATPLPPAHLVDFAQSKASSLEEYFGQAVLLEFFAYW
ncbi:hypothetical protein [Engelhardtia mirabilis]|uniref:Uncharacterized protein n=1 Tax=Engelhardtia mirabilis TaxID=2528011 RepID=A0A518BDN5_9BACT|nr:hypothetical protein Pla133_01390 [Planctomycetes bacterium Pla133]QDU99402.1 hypothetical protein Pla86_01390 [Planctomycetes bacterium Pla86]